MAVVVDDRHAAGLGDLEAPAGSGEARQHRLGRATGDACKLERRKRRACVAAVVLARNGELALVGSGIANRPAAPRSPSGRTPPRARRASGTRCGGRARRSSRPRSPPAGRTPFGPTRRPRRRATLPPRPRSRPSCGTGAPISHAGSRPVSRRTNAIIAAVVPLPCVPATTIERRRPTSSARNSRRARPGTSGYADETTTSQPSGTTGSGPISSRASRSGSRYGVSTRSQPPTSAPHARASCAYADSPAPPIPTNQIRRPSSGRKRDQLLGDLVRRVRPRRPQHRLAHLRKARRDRRAATARGPARPRGRARAP